MYGVYYYSIVFYWRGGHCCPTHCGFFKIYCAPPNLGITRTWICRLNFAQRPIFSGLRIFNEPEISDSGSQLKVPPGRLVLRISTSWKNPSTSVGFEPANLGCRGEHVTPRPPRPTWSILRYVFYKRRNFHARETILFYLWQYYLTKIYYTECYLILLIVCWILKCFILFITGEWIKRLWFTPYNCFKLSRK